MEFCCLLPDNLQNLLFEKMDSMKITKSLDLEGLRDIFMNLEIFEYENEFSNKISSISERAKKCFEISQKQILKEKYLMTCRIYLYDHSPSNNNLYFHENFFEKIFEITEYKKDKIILLLYSLISSTDKKVDFPEILFLAISPALKNGQKTDYLKFKNIVTEYFQKLLLASYTALGTVYSTNHEIFQEILDTLNHKINQEKIHMFEEFIFRKFEEKNFFSQHIKNKQQQTNKKTPQLSTEEKQAILEYKEINKQEIQQLLEKNDFLHNFFEFHSIYFKFHQNLKFEC